MDADKSTSSEEKVSSHHLKRGASLQEVTFQRKAASEEVTSSPEEAASLREVMNVLWDIYGKVPYLTAEIWLMFPLLCKGFERKEPVSHPSHLPLMRLIINRSDHETFKTLKNISARDDGTLQPDRWLKGDMILSIVVSEPVTLMVTDIRITEGQYGTRFWRIKIDDRLDLPYPYGLIPCPAHSWGIGEIIFSERTPYGITHDERNINAWKAVKEIRWATEKMHRVKVKDPDGIRMVAHSKPALMLRVVEIYQEVMKQLRTRIKVFRDEWDRVAEELVYRKAPPESWGTVYPPGETEHSSEEDFVSSDDV
jgi:hypothetical protein